MITYTYRCAECGIDWLKQFSPKEKPAQLVCAKCGRLARSVITTAPGVVFKDAGFPGNDMKHLHTGSSSGMRGRKPTSKELEYVEEHYPDSSVRKSLENGDFG